VLDLQQSKELVSFGRSEFLGVEFLGQCIKWSGVFCEVVDVKDSLRVRQVIFFQLERDGREEAK